MCLSSPINAELATTVCASAPGKVILFGEHSVVYGEPAIAAALSDLRLYVRLSVSAAAAKTENGCSPNSMIRLQFPNLVPPLDGTLPIAPLLSLRHRLQEPPTTDCHNLLEQMVQEHYKDNNNSTKTNNDSHASPHSTETQQTHAILPALYLMARLAPSSILEQQQQQQGSCITVQADSHQLPLGAGLGSSAAFGVACAAALMQWRHPVVDPPQAMTSGRTPCPKTVQEINRYAYYSEILLHGQPSGMDNTVSSHGGALRFVRTNKTRAADSSPTNDTDDNEQPEEACHQTMEPIAFQQPIQVLLVYTHVPRPTKRLLATVRDMYQQHPTIVKPILKAMGQIVHSFCNVVGQTPEEENRTTTTTTQLFDKSTVIQNQQSTILSLVRTNHGLLSALGVSHPSLDRIVEIVQSQSHVPAAAKLTGAGGGGCAMILYFSSNNNDNADLVPQQLRNALQAQSDYQYSFYTSTVGGRGVLYESPSAFDDC